MKSRKILFLTASAAICLFTTACQRHTQMIPCCNVVEESYIHKYGVEVPAHDWTYRGENGKVITTLGNGVIVTKSYEQGILHGESTYTFPHSSTIERREFYQNGRMIQSISYNHSGLPIESIEFLQDGTHKVTQWYADNSPKSIEIYQEDLLISGEYYNSANKADAHVDHQNGIRPIRDDYGQLLATETIENGKISQQTLYHPNGTPRVITPYKEGKISGVRKLFLPGGEPEAEEEWIQDRQEGITTLFRNGERYARITFRDGRKNGVELRYKEDGETVAEEICWADNQRHGPCHTYVADSVRTDWYFAGNLVSKSYYYFLSSAPFR